MFLFICIKIFISTFKNFIIYFLNKEILKRNHFLHKFYIRLLHLKKYIKLLKKLYSTINKKFIYLYREKEKKGREKKEKEKGKKKRREERKRDSF